MYYEVFVLQLLWYDFYVMAFLNGIVVLAMVAAANKLIVEPRGWKLLVSSWSGSWLLWSWQGIWIGLGKSLAVGRESSCDLVRVLLDVLGALDDHAVRNLTSPWRRP